MLFRRYSADLTPVLKYVVHQLHNRQTTELVVLRELIWKMAGVADLQAQDRAHQIGQTKAVLILRFITEKSVEEAVYQRA